MDVCIVDLEICVCVCMCVFIYTHTYRSIYILWESPNNVVGPFPEISLPFSCETSFFFFFVYLFIYLEISSPSNFNSEIRFGPHGINIICEHFLPSYKAYHIFREASIFCIVRFWIRYCYYFVLFLLSFSCTLASK